MNIPATPFLEDTGFPSTSSGLCSIPAPASTRPELRTEAFSAVHHNYARMTSGSTSRPLVEGLWRCLPATHLLKQHEEDLFTTGVIRENGSSLASLEKRLLDLGRTGACHGLLLVTLFQHSDFSMARVITHGCLQGVEASPDIMDVFKSRLPPGPFRSYSVFSEKDLSNRKRKRQSSTESSRPPRDRWGQIFKSNVRIVKQHLEHLQLLAAEEAGTCLKGGAVYLLKKASKGNKEEDRFFFPFGCVSDDSLALEELLNSYRMSEDHGDRRPRKELQDLGQNPSIEEQLEALGSLSNHCDNIRKINEEGAGCLREMSKAHFPYCFVTCNRIKKKCTPYMFRVRLLYYLLKGDQNFVQTMLNDFAGAGQEMETSELQVPPEAEDVGPQRAEGRTPCVASRPSRTAEELQEELGYYLPPVTNQASQLSAFSSFQTSMQERGHVYWVKHHQPRVDTFALNDYSSKTSRFQVTNFVLAEVVNGRVIQCGCDTFKLLLTTEHEGKCMHRRFLEEQVVPLMERVQVPGFVPSSQTERKLLEAWQAKNDGCFSVGPASDRVRKFCVAGKDGSFSFVHLCVKKGSVCCTSGECSVRMCFKKKLQSLGSAKGLCPHLDMFKAWSELWQPFLAATDEDEDEEETGAGEDAEDQDQTPADMDMDMENFFDSATGLWNFGGHSKHCPTAEDDDLLARNKTGRLAVIQLPRDDKGFLTGHVLRPSKPDSCACGAGYEDVHDVDEDSLVTVQQTTLYTEVGAVKCTVAALKCRGRTCTTNYNPAEDSIFFWSESTCIGDEIGYSFLDKVLNMKCSFSAFCKSMTKTYTSYNRKAASFVSAPTFLNWYFSWAAAMQIDFRKDVDPWCQHSPKILAGDGTHVGVSLRQMTITPIDQAEVDEEIETKHRRYDRVFLYQGNGRSNVDLRQARDHLKATCRRVMGEDSTAVDGDQADSNRLLLKVCPEEARTVVNGLVHRSFAPDVLFSVADVLFVLGCDAPVSALLPYKCIDVVLEVVRNLELDSPPADCLEPLNRVSPELKRLLKAASTTCHADRCDILRFVRYLTERVRSVHSRDVDPQAPVAAPQSYNPPSGVAYYFTESGKQLRKLPRYQINGAERRDQHDDPPAEEERCKKVYPQVGREGFSYMFLWFCPVHGHCYGFHLISGGEGRKDPFASLFKYVKEAPEVVFYDNACQLSEYSLNREPAFFRSTRYFHDCFHGFSHKCAKTYCSARIPHLRVNSEICEQFNSRLQCIKYTGSHLSQPRFVFLAQLVLHYWNQEKTRLLNQKLEVAHQGME